MFRGLILLIGAAVACKPSAPPREDTVADQVEEQEDITDPSPSTWVEHLPSAKGKVSGGVQEAYTGNPRQSVFDRKVHSATVTGAVYMHLSTPKQYKGRASYEISVEQGKLRLYFADDKSGYRYIEATPGHPAKISGWMMPADPYRVLLEAVDGDAQGVTYHFWRNAFARG